MSDYAALTDLYAYGLSAVQCGSVSEPVRQQQLDARNAWADGKLRGRYNLPLLTWGVDLKMAVAQLAAYDVMCIRGFNPAAGADVNIRLRHDDAIKWFDQMQRQAVHPTVTETPRQAPAYDAPSIRTKPKRGW